MPIVLKSGGLNLLEPSGLVQACNGIALLFYYCINNGYFNTKGNRNGKHGMDSSGSAERRVTKASERDKETLVSIKLGEFLD